MGDVNVDEIHVLPLVNRLVDDEIRRWLDRHLGLQQAGYGEPEAPMRAAVEQSRHLHLDNYDYALTPKILDALRRAGQLKGPLQFTDEQVEAAARALHEDNCFGEDYSGDPFAVEGDMSSHRIDVLTVLSVVAEMSD